MAKENKKKLILWAVVALVIGVLIGVLMTNAVTTGKATSASQEAKFRNTDLYLDGDLRLDQGFDNVSGYNHKNYFYIQWEYANSNLPAIFEKQSSFSTSEQYSIGKYDRVKLILLDGQYSENGYSYAFIPFNQNNLSIYSAINGAFISESGQSIYQHQESVENPNGDVFAEVTYFDFECNSQYIMEHTNVGNISDVHFYLDIFDTNSTDNWHYDWDSTPQRNYYYIGFFPNDASTILTNGLDHQVYLSVYITTNNQTLTTASTYKLVNCQTGKSSALSSEQLEQIKEKTGNTPKQIAEKFASEHTNK